MGRVGRRVREAREQPPAERGRERAEAGGAGGGAGGGVGVGGWKGAWYVGPAPVEVAEQAALVKRETLAPLLWVMRYSDFETALDLHNAVPQGLASSIFTGDLREAELFLSAR
ncbi:MAG TPA: aldehyde dehydrogenase family protein, partial [Burkholderiaceae bacterium]|nr:aldehyde dehydrogenase family protein [Burkholderiaceae bacterium]